MKIWRWEHFRSVHLTRYRMGEMRVGGRWVGKGRELKKQIIQKDCSSNNRSSIKRRRTEYWAKRRGMRILLKSCDLIKIFNFQQNVLSSSRSISLLRKPIIWFLYCFRSFVIVIDFIVLFASLVYSAPYFPSCKTMQ